jgi:hypothetical protein
VNPRVPISTHNQFYKIGSCQPDSRSDGQTDHESGRATGRFAKEIPIVGRRNLDPRKMTMRSWRKIREGTVVSGKKLR